MCCSCQLRFLQFPAGFCETAVPALTHSGAKFPDSNITLPIRELVRLVDREVDGTLGRPDPSVGDSSDLTRIPRWRVLHQLDSPTEGGQETASYLRTSKNSLVRVNQLPPEIIAP